MTTKYNVLYNGDIALEKGKATLNNAYTENFWQLLAVERMQVDKDIIRFDNDAENPSFKIAEEKAIKAIQKHSMNIKGKEKNPQMDEAYLLLGKARYYDQRFVPALAAFNFIMNKYPTSDKINQVKIWREKANMRMDNNKIAIKKLKRLIKLEDLEDEDLADATATLAQAYINIKSKDSAVTQLKIALNSTKIKEQKARYHFILGQLYNEFGKKDSANIEFDAIVDMHRKIPRAYYINAHLQRSFNFDSKEGDLLEFKEYLTDLEENRENRPFLDKIYHRIAEFHREQNSDSLAEAYYNKSLRKTTKDEFLKAINYETLGNMYFDRNTYKTAGEYYDSTLTAMVENSKPYRVLEKKRRNLDDVIYYEDIAKVNDSILYIVGLPKDEQLAYFTKITDSLKLEADKEEELRREALKRQLTSNNNSSSNGINIRSAASTTSQGGKFYFYNATTLAYGKNEFQRIWGKRKLADNWRLSNQSINIQNANSTNAVATVEDKKQLFDPKFYLDKIPTDQKVIDSIAKERNYAYYELGVIYKEKFKELELAQNRFETLLTNTPEERLILPSKYNLYQIYEALSLVIQSEAIKNDIIQNYADSRYAEILLNPDSQLTRGENNPVVIYEKLYKQFENQEYASVINKAETQIKKMAADDIVPKFELLKASAEGRLYGFEAYKKALNYVALTYTNSEEGKKAEALLKDAIPSLEKKEFIENSEASHFNIIYEFSNTEDISGYIQLLKKEIENVDYFTLKVAKEVYNENTTFIVVYGLKSLEGAKGYAQALKNDKRDANGNVVKSRINKPYFTISSSNYAILQRHKTLNKYKQIN